MIPRQPFAFIRHGQAAHNLEMRMVGPATPSMLTDKGIEQALAAAPKLTGKGINRIYSSPLQRAVDTATLINKSLGVPLEARPFLTEQDYGAWNNRLYHEVCAETLIDPNTFDYLHRVPADGESWQALQKRVEQGLIETLTTHPNELLLFVSHGGVFNAVHHVLLGHIEETANATPYLFKPVASGWEMVELCT